MADPVDTAELREAYRTLRSESDAEFLLGHFPALLDSLDSLRSKLAESEAACAVLAEALKRRAADECPVIELGEARREDCECCPCSARHTLANLPASVQRHLKEVEALREVAAGSKEEHENEQTAVHRGSARSLGDCPQCRRLAALDAVRKGGAT